MRKQKSGTLTRYSMSFEKKYITVSLHDKIILSDKTTVGGIVNEQFEKKSINMLCRLGKFGVGKSAHTRNV
ncbi:MAG: hypothetical protein ACLVCH_05120 [Roseburia inulinivorans]